MDLTVLAESRRPMDMTVLAESHGIVQAHQDIVCWDAHHEYNPNRTLVMA